MHESSASAEVSQYRGLIQVYTGDGKGKTTAALGLCMRAVGSGMRAIVLQFMKAGGTTSELRSAERLSPELTIRQLGRSPSFITGRPSPEDIEHAKHAWADARKAVLSGEYDLVVLDELNVVLDLGMLSCEEVIECLKERPQHVEVVLTGRKAPKAILDMADLITEMRCIRHPYERGIPARLGIEY